MPATTIGTAGLVWGITAESGILIDSFERKIVRDKKEVKNETGEVSAVSFYNIRATYSGAGYTTGAGSLLTVVPGNVFTPANGSSGNGVTAGSVYIDEITRTKANEDFEKLSFTATQYPLI